MKLTKAQRNALRTLSQGEVEDLRDKFIRQDVMWSLVKAGLAEWHNFAGMRSGYTITSEGKRALEAGR